MHVFEPTQRRIWTVVGKGKEHWIDPDAGYCSCPAFYFARLSREGSAPCYHLKSAGLAIDEDRVERIIFSDDEFAPFLDGLIADM